MYINIPFKYIPAGINPERHGAVGKAHCFFLGDTSLAETCKLLVWESKFWAKYVFKCGGLFFGNLQGSSVDLGWWFTQISSSNLENHGVAGDIR